MPVDKYKDVTIEDRKFRIRLIPASTGNWIVKAYQFAYKDKAVFNQIQAYCFDVCYLLKDNPAPDKPQLEVKIFYAPDQWRVPELDMENSFLLLNQLYDEVIDFNFTPFFKKRAEKIAELADASRTATQDTSQPGSQTT